MARRNTATRADNEEGGTHWELADRNEDIIDGGIGKK
jgi:hypothetical protein